MQLTVVGFRMKKQGECKLEMLGKITKIFLNWMKWLKTPVSETISGEKDRFYQIILLWDNEYSGYKHDKWMQEQKNFSPPQKSKNQWRASDNFWWKSI